MKSKMALTQSIGKTFRKSTPMILTCISAAGVIATTVLAVRATPKALKRIETAQNAKIDENGEKLTRKETIEACWQCYIPAAVTGIATIGCIFSANTLNRHQQAALASAYALVNRQFQDYKNKVKEIYGREAHEKIMNELAVEKSTKPPITAGTMIGACTLGFEDSGEEDRLFYDSFSERYFQATISQVLQAEYHLNRNLVISGNFMTLNDFYEFLGIDKTPEGDTLGWMLSDGLYWIDFDHIKSKVDDGLNGEVECYIIDMPFAPMLETDYDV